MKFKVEYSVEKDTIPYLKAVWKMQYRSFGRENLSERLLKKFPKSFQKDIQEAKTEEDAKKVINDFLNNNLKNNKAKYEENIKGIQKSLDGNKDKIIRKLEKLFNKEFPFDEITIYLTTAGICPYNFEKRWFMIYGNADKQTVVDVATHELNHFMFFYYYFDDLKKSGINPDKLLVLKEALVVLSDDDTDNKPETAELKQVLKSVEGRPMGEVIEIAIKSDAFKNISAE